MLNLGALAFAAPWALAALAILPVLWWLLKVTPPSPRSMSFPAIRLLFGLEAREDAAARTPWWILALRLAIALAIILGVAQPLLNPGQPMARAGGPLVVAVDDGWASARDWAARRAWLDDLLARAERVGRPVVVLPTAPPADGTVLAASPLQPAAEARALIQALEPKPWPTDRAAALEAVKAIPRDQVTQAVWLSDGLEDGRGGGQALARALQTLGGGLEMVTGVSGRLLLPPAETAAADRLTVTLRRLTGFDRPDRAAVRALDGAGRVLGREEATLAAGQAEAAVTLRLPGELRNRLVRLDVENEQGAGSVVLLDERWRRRPVGLAGSGDESQPLLAQLYYVERALAPHAELHKGEVSELLGRELAMMVLADVPAVLGTSAERLRGWVEQGGVLVRFAGPLLAHAAAEDPGAGDPLLPVRLRDGGRAMGGAMSWTAPQGLAAFPPESPFAGLAVSDEIKVTAQVLAEPSLELAERTWARLADGTPLVTAARRDKGWVVLVHTTANAAWSNLALSGLFVDMLRRLTGLAEGIAGTAAAGPLPPAELLDGFGRLTAPAGAATALTGPADAVRPGPRNPPGFYGNAGAKVAVNLGPSLPRLTPLTPPPGVTMTLLGAGGREIDLKPALLTIALSLTVVDLLASLALRGLLRRAAAAVVALLMLPPLAKAADTFALDATLATRLAYIRTGDAAIDRKSQAGLTALSQVVGQRSTASLAEPMGVDIEKDPVLFFPLLYWPLVPGQQAPSAAAAEKLNAYMRAGGLIVLDTGAGGDAAGLGEPEVVKVLTEGLAIPALAPVTDEHVLTRAFYLLREMPGRWDGGVWVGAGAGAINDGVSPVVVGGNDWAGAWATDDRGRPMFATVPGGERQRELAYRFGINLVMYALTGNYKADQVHLPAILERLGR